MMPNFQKITKAEAENVGYSWPLFSRTKLLGVFITLVGIGVLVGLVAYKGLDFILP
jgi:uncharacterized membrane protein YkgB